MPELASVCPLDCPDTCSLTVTVEGERIVAVRGSKTNPYTAGVVCAKVPAAYPEWVHGPGRLLTPLRRTGAKGEGRFERIGWAEALDVIHERWSAIIAAHGPEAILPLNYAGPHGMPVVTSRRSLGSFSSSGRGNAVRSRIATTTSKSARRLATASSSCRCSRNATTSVPAGRVFQSASPSATS